MESFIAICVLLLVGHILRSKLKLLQWLYLPSCVIAGLVGLAVVQLAPQIGWDIPAAWTAGWSKLPGILINIVFACLFLGIEIPGIKKIWRNAGPQLAYGQVVAWGQYVVGIGLVLFILGPIFEVPDMFGAVIPVGFEGGHGTAAGLAETFSELNWEEGKDFALSSATVGMVSAIVIGMVLINIAIRRGVVANAKKPSDFSEDDAIGVIPVDKRPSAGNLTVSADAIETFTLHLVFVGIAVGIGYGLKIGMVWLEQTINADLINQANSEITKIATKAAKEYKNNGLRIVVKSFPTFPLCMIGGLLVQLWEQKFDKHKLMDLGLTRRIQNSALDFLVVPAIAMISIAALLPAWKPFVILIAAGICWNIFCVMFLARRMLPNVWFERSIAEMGQSMGVTSTGLMLLRIVDPNYKTPAANAFAYKQIMHEPFMGGGLWTSMAIPLLALWGGRPVFAIACGAVGIWLILTFFTPLINRK